MDTSKLTPGAAARLEALCRAADDFAQAVSEVRVTAPDRRTVRMTPGEYAFTVGILGFIFGGLGALCGFLIGRR